MLCPLQTNSSTFGLSMDPYWLTVLLLLGGIVMGLAILAVAWTGPALDPKVRPYRRRRYETSPDQPDVQGCDVQWLHGHLVKLTRDAATGEVLSHEPLRIPRDQLYWTLDFPSVVNRAVGKFQSFRHPGLFKMRMTINQVPSRVVSLRDAVVETSPDSLDPHVFEQDITTAWLRHRNSKNDHLSWHRVEREGWTLRVWDSDESPR